MYTFICHVADILEQSLEADDPLPLWASIGIKPKWHSSRRLPYCSVWGFSTEVCGFQLLRYL